MKSKAKNKKVTPNTTNWTICKSCHGASKTRRQLSKKERLAYKQAVTDYEQSGKKGVAPKRPKSNFNACKKCDGSGLTTSTSTPALDDKNFPRVAIIGGGIGGVALAVACQHRGIPYTLYERDNNFDARSQGYGLTLQQANKAMKGFGIVSLTEGVVSTKHIVHTTDGTIIGEWGMRKWVQPEEKKPSKKSNIHIARQSLRLALLNQLNTENNIRWGHQFVDFKELEGKKVTLRFEVDGKLKTETADLVVGADGIRSTVRELLIGKDVMPLQYLGCIVILGICPLKDLKDVESPLLDSATVFQTVNGHERIYMMPFDSGSMMWQLSFPMSEIDAKQLSSQGSNALKKEACRRLQWHHPIPQILAATQVNQISGYPVYDRAPLKPESLNSQNITLLGDAAHPMSPFKGQGANQALLDALALARGIYKDCNSKSNWQEAGLRQSILTSFELEMLKRTATKVKDSAEAARILHSKMVLRETDEPRGSFLKRS